MFESDVVRDPESKRITRRVFVGGGAAIAAGIVVFSVRQSRLFEAKAVEAGAVVHGTPGEVTLVNFSDDGKNLGTVTVAKVVKPDGEWLKQLGANSFGIARQADTEVPYTGVTWKEHAAGIYRCICCDTALFSSKTKFDSGTGWPSFWAPLAKENVVEKTDTSLGMDRTEVTCARCDGHLGHVFNDGPAPTGLRYCMNSASMRFVKA